MTFPSASIKAAGAPPEVKDGVGILYQYGAIGVFAVAFAAAFSLFAWYTHKQLVARVNTLDGELRTAEREKARAERAEEVTRQLAARAERLETELRLADRERARAERAEDGLSRAQDRADRAEKELRDLHQVVQDKIVPAVVASNSAVQESMRLVSEFVSERRVEERVRRETGKRMSEPHGG